MEKTAQRFAFGVYEADAKSGELRKNGIKIKLQEQPFQILIMLLERPGEVVTREELRLRVWPADTFVDFDHGLNTSINKLREALGDSASNPRFVETLARRGYRFIAPVRTIESGQRAADSAQPVSTESTGVAPGLRSGEDASQTRPRTVANAAARQVGEHDSQPGIQAIASTTQQISAVPDAGIGRGLDLPLPSRWVPRTLFALIQIMYVVFYGIALVRLDAIPDIAADFLGRATVVLIPLILVTAAIGIALRLYLVTAVSFDFKPLGEKFRRLFPLILPLDQLWALSPFLLAMHIGVGGAFAACAALLYLPFSERTLIKMGYRYGKTVSGF
jgi:cholera toxin transcriptional activator